MNVLVANQFRFCNRALTAAYTCFSIVSFIMKFIWVYVVYFFCFTIFDILICCPIFKHFKKMEVIKIEFLKVFFDTKFLWVKINHPLILGNASYQVEVPPKIIVVTYPWMFFFPCKHLIESQVNYTQKSSLLFYNQW